MNSVALELDCLGSKTGTISVTLGKLLHLCVLQSIYLLKGDENNLRIAVRIQ